MHNGASPVRPYTSRSIPVITLITLTLPLLTLHCTSGREGDDRFAEVRSRIHDFMEDENVPSVSVAVAEHGAIVWEEAFGWANRERQIKATPQTMYEIASIAKVFTATGLMVLRERGLIDLDAPVERYLGGLKITAFGVNPSGVTLRRIIHHTSGLPMFWGEPSINRSTHSLTPTDILARYAILTFPPGERELYSNLGIALTSRVIEYVSKKSCTEFLRQEIFVPLEMENAMHLTASPTTDRYAQEYMVNGERWEYVEGTFVSAHDLLRFCMFHLRNRMPDSKPILSDSSIELMQTDIDPVSEFRFPWWVWEYEGFAALVFTGASGAIIAIVPEADLAIVVLSNRLQAATPRICGWIADVMLHDVDENKRLPTHVRTHQKLVPPSLSPMNLKGMWKGTISTYEREIPAEIRFGDPSGPMMRSMVDSAAWSDWVTTMPALRGEYKEGVFSAYFPLRIPGEDTRAHDHWTWIYVGQRTDTLQGYAVAHASGGPHFGLPYFIRLVRDRSESSD